MKRALVVRGEKTPARLKGVAKQIRAKRERIRELAETLDRLIMVDGSTSMARIDSVNRAKLPCSRFDAATEAWDWLVPQLAGRLMTYVFSDGLTPVATGDGVISVLPFPRENTAMCNAMQEIIRRSSNPNLRTLLIGDGESTDGDPVPLARTAGTPIDTVFVGPRGVSGEAGRKTLRAIAKVTGGTFTDYSGSFDVNAFLTSPVAQQFLEAGA